MKGQLSLLVFLGYFFSQSCSFLFSRDFFFSSLRSSSYSSSSSLAAKSAASKTATPVEATNPPADKAAFQSLLAKKEGPDFYSKYRLARLIKQYNDSLPFKRQNYPGKTTDIELYDAYVLDLLVKGKVKWEEFDVEKENIVSAAEWETIFEEMVDWTDSVDRPIPAASIPESPFDLLEVFYPELKKNFQELESPLGDADLPYRSKKEMLEDAFRGKFLPQGYDKELNVEDLEKELDRLEAKAIGRVDALTKKMIAEIESSSPALDSEALAFYQKAKEVVSGSPVTRAQWEADRKKNEQLIEEMAALAATPEEEHHGHHGGDDHHDEDSLSIAEQFKQKYGRDLKKIQERLSKFNSNSNNYVENVVQEAGGGPQGLDWWKEIEKTYEENYAKLTDGERESLVQEYKTFLNSLPLSK